MAQGTTSTVITISLALVAVRASAQSLADEVARHQPFENLQVLEEEIDADRLASMMGEIKNAIGSEQGCLFCHVGEPSKPLSTWSFASDTKVEKRVARQMMRMVRSINDGFLSDLPGRTGPITVTCRTCHDGRPRPIPLENLLLEVLRRDGREGMVDRYRRLRERYYGAGAYDFQEHVLRRLAAQLNEDENDDRLAILTLNLELYPDSWRTLNAKGQAYLDSGERELAEVAFLRSLEIRRSQDAIDGLRLARSGDDRADDGRE